MFPPGFPDIFDALVFPSSVFITRRSMGNAENRRSADLCPQTTPVKRGDSSRPSQSIQSRHIKDWMLGRPAQKFAAHLTLRGGKASRTKRRRWTIFGSQQRPIGGKIRNENTTINQYNLSIDVLGAHLCDAGGIGRLWLSQSHISSAAHSVCVFTWLIVMNRIFSCCTCPMKLKLSHVKRIGIGQPRTCLLFGLQMRSGQERGSPW